MTLLRLGSVGLLVMALLPLWAMTVEDGDSAVVTLSSLRDASRPLLIFARDANDERLKEQLRILDAHKAEAAERNLLPIVIQEQGDVATDKRLNASGASEARRKFQIAAGEFMVVLVGKDGGEKFRSKKPIPFAKLAETIDAMPMRKDEMKRK